VALLFFQDASCLFALNPDVELSEALRLQRKPIVPPPPHNLSGSVLLKGGPPGDWRFNWSVFWFFFCLGKCRRSCSHLRDSILSERALPPLYCLPLILPFLHFYSLFFFYPFNCHVAFSTCVGFPLFENSNPLKSRHLSSIYFTSAEVGQGRMSNLHAFCSRVHVKGGPRIGGRPCGLYTRGTIADTRIFRVDVLPSSPCRFPPSPPRHLPHPQVPPLPPPHSHPPFTRSAPLTSCHTSLAFSNPPSLPPLFSSSYPSLILPISPPPTPLPFPIPASLLTPLILTPPYPRSPPLLHFPLTHSPSPLPPALPSPTPPSLLLSSPHPYPRFSLLYLQPVPLHPPSSLTHPITSPPTPSLPFHPLSTYSLSHHPPHLLFPPSSEVHPSREKSYPQVFNF